MSTRTVVPTAEAMRELGREVARLLRAGDLVLLTGDLGAGKTTLAAGIGEGLGVRGRVTSPTFVIAREHPHPGGGTPLVHVDAYRLDRSLGLDELDGLDLDSGLEDVVTLVEWGTGLVEGLAPDRLEVLVVRPHGDGPGPAGDDAAGDGAAQDGAAHDDVPRTVTLTGVGDRWAGVRLPGR